MQGLGVWVDTLHWHCGKLSVWLGALIQLLEDLGRLENEGHYNIALLSHRTRVQNKHTLTPPMSPKRLSTMEFSTFE